MTTRIVTPRNNPYSHKPCPRCYQPMRQIIGGPLWRCNNCGTHIAVKEHA